MAVGGLGVAFQDENGIPFGVKNTDGSLEIISRLEDENGVAFGIKNTSGSLNTISKSFELSVMMGEVSDVSTVDRFGINTVIETTSVPEDVWEFGGVYPFSTTADIVSLSSSDITDTQDIKITGLTLDGTLTEQTITLTGQTIATLTTPLWRIFGMENEASTGSDLAGTVYCFSGTDATLGVPDLASVVKATIDDGNNQTLMAIYTIPKEKVGFLYKGELGLHLDAAPASAQTFMTGTYKSRRYGKVFKIKKHLTNMSSGSSTFQDKRSFPDIIPALTDIKISIDAVGETMGAWATFDVMLVDETSFSTAYLTAIGQPGY